MKYSVAGFSCHMKHLLKTCVPACELAQFCKLDTVRSAYIHWNIVPTMDKFEVQVLKQGPVMKLFRTVQSSSLNNAGLAWS